MTPIARYTLLGGGLLLSLWYFTGGGSSSAEPDSLPPDDVGPRVRSWQRMTLDPFPVGSGKVYRGIIALPWYLPSSAATPGAVAAYASSMGFTNAKSWRARPDGFPGTEKGDLYVEATWAGGCRDLARPAPLVAAYVLAG